MNSAESNVNDVYESGIVNEIMDEIKIISMLTSYEDEAFTSLDPENKGQLKEALEAVYEKAFEIVNMTSSDSEEWRNIQSYYTETLDRLWISHLDNLHHLREGISIRGYGQEDPYRLYSFDALHLFQGMLHTFFRDVIRYNFQVYWSERRIIFRFWAGRFYYSFLLRIFFYDNQEK